MFALEDIEAAPLLGDLVSRLTLKVTSWSMFPTIHKGDRLEIGRGHPLSVGDVVLFRGEPGFVCHRVRAIGADGGVRARGDASPGPDEPLRPEDVIGIVTAIIRSGVKLSPIPVLRPSTGARFRRAVDHFATRSGACAMAFARRGLVALRRRPVIKRAAQTLLPHIVRLDMAFPFPLRCLSGVRVVPLGRVPVEADRTAPDLLPERVEWQDTILRLRIGPCIVATYHAASATMSVCSAASGLGLEDLLSEQAVRIRPLFERPLPGGRISRLPAALT